MSNVKNSLRDTRHQLVQRHKRHHKSKLIGIALGAPSTNSTKTQILVSSRVLSRQGRQHTKDK
eukprot:scaffold15561_cov179-Amphora_coffeaeformis.AAC.5